jgi:hypothetical protein
VIPPFDERGNLPPGIHGASWDAIRDRFGGNEWRRTLLGGVLRAVRDLKRAGCQRVWLDGSFVTDREFPGDFDLCYDVASVDIDAMEPALLDRTSSKGVYGGDILPTFEALSFLDFFQQDRDGNVKGIIEIELGSLL